MNEAHHLGLLLRPEMRAKMAMVDKLKLLFDHRTPIVGSPDGWTIALIENTVRCADFEAAIEGALNVLAMHYPPPAEAS
ncbi:MAG TPA: hypothetical protein VEQ62_18060 [Stellaceae bacterium]|jgi:hypothetical protein|nr:hypothetical protein [Stellaceae bacterium]